MHIRIINPNSTASMTRQALERALVVKNADTQVSAVNPLDTPLSIEGGAGEALGVDAYIIACFDDPGLHAAREVARGPVLGICQAAVQVAMTISRRFSVITTLPRSVPIIEELVSAYGADRHCRKVRSINLPVLSLEESPVEAEALLLREIERSTLEDGAEAVILGCAGMSTLCDRLTEVSGVPVIDGVTAAMKLAEALVVAGYTTSKVNSYNYPREKSAGCVVCA